MTNQKNMFSKFFLEKKSTIQRVIFTVLLIASIINLVYAYGFSTNWAGGILVNNDEFLIAMNKYNHLLEDFALFAIVAVALAFIFGAKTRSRYYISNTITGILSGGLVFWNGLWILINNGKHLNIYLAKDLSIVYQATQLKTSTLVFDLGWFVSILSVIVGLLVIAYTIYETVRMANYKKVTTIGRGEPDVSEN